MRRAMPRQPTATHVVVGHKRTQQGDGAPMDVAGWEEELELERRQKDQFFAIHPQSPLTHEDRRLFEGLA